MSIFKILLAGLLVISGVSCQKLTEEPKGILTPSNFYKNPAQCDAALAASMNILFSKFIGYSYLSTTFPDGQMNNASLDYGGDFLIELWKMHYKAISNVNAVLKAVKSGNLSSYTPAQVAIVQGNAKFLRAYNYFSLVRFYGKIPFITEDTPDPTVTPLTTDSKLEVAKMYDKN